MSDKYGIMFSFSVRHRRWLLKQKTDSYKSSKRISTQSKTYLLCCKFFFFGIPPICRTELIAVVFRIWIECNLILKQCQEFFSSFQFNPQGKTKIGDNYEQKLYSVLAVMLFVCLWSAAGFFTVSSQTANTLNEGSEAGGKTAYSVGNVALGSGTWTLDDAPIIWWSSRSMPNPITGTTADRTGRAGT